MFSRVSGILRGLSERIAAGRSLIFLGTGPSKPIDERSGKSNRKNTSTLIKYKGGECLIDIPPDFDTSIGFSHLLLTHLHDDSFGGIKKVVDRTFVMGLTPDLEKELTKKGRWPKMKKKLEEMKVQDLRVDRVNDFGGFKITPFEVVHDIVDKYNTFGYRIEFKDGTTLVYAADMVTVPEKAEQHFEKVDILVVDGAGWNGSSATHFGMWPFLDLVKEKGWDIKKIYFTQIDRPVPDHAIAQKEISARDKRAHLAWDGLEVAF